MTLARPAARPPFWDALRHTPLWTVLLGLAVVAGMWVAPPLLVPGLLCGAIGFGLLVRRPVLGVYGLVLSVPVQKVVTLGPLTVTQALLGVALLAWWIHLLMERRRLIFPPVALALGLYLVAMGVSLTVAENLGEAFAEIYRWVVVVGAYLLAVNLVRTRRQIGWLVASFLLAAAGEAALGLAQTALGAGPTSFVFANLGTRSYGTIGMPNSYAGYLNLTLPLALALAVWAVLAARDRWRTADRLRAAAHDSTGYAAAHTARWATWRQLALAGGLLTVTGVIAGGVLTSLSRGSWLGLAFGVVAMIAALGRRGLPALVALVVAGALAGLLYAYGALPAILTERLGSIVDQFQVFDVRGVKVVPENFAQIERLAHWQTAGNMFLSNLWLGIGIGNFNVRFPDFNVPQWPYSQGHAHNYYLQALAETGLAGFGAYALVLLAAIGGGLRALGRTTGLDRALVVGALGVLATFMLHNMFEDLHVLNLGIHWAAVLALFVVVPRAASAESGIRDQGSGIRDQVLTPNPQPPTPNPQWEVG